MTQTTTAQRGTGGVEETLATRIERLLEFSGPPPEFLARLLDLQRQSAEAEAGIVFRFVEAGKAEVLAAAPAPADPQKPPAWWQHAVDSAPRALAGGQTIVAALSAPGLGPEAPTYHVLATPLASGIAGGLVCAVAVRDLSGRQLDQAVRRLERTALLPRFYELRQSLGQRSADLARLQSVLGLLAEVAAHERFRAAAMAVVNHAAAAFSAERASVGFLKERYVRVAALSHTEKFTRKMKLVQDLESAMEEALDQDVEVLHPAPAPATFISRSAAELARAHGAGCVATFPLRRNGKPVAALTVERAADRPFRDAELETLRLACELCTPHLVTLHRHDRWVGAKTADTVRTALSAALGPRHTWAKAAAATVAAVLAFLLFWPATDRVEAPVVVQAVERRVVPAPFEGYLDEVRVEPGDPVVADQTVLATLDRAELRLALAQAQARLVRFGIEADKALREGKTADHQIAQAQAREIQAEISLLDYRIRKGEIRAPISGVVVQGDLKRRQGAKVTPDQVLFEIAPVGAFWLELSVPEARIADVRRGQRGEFASAARPGVKLAFEVVRISPLAELVDQRNVFQVRAQVRTTVPDVAHLQANMEGLAKIDVGRSNYLSLWLRPVVNWLRMKLWF